MDYYATPSYNLDDFSLLHNETYYVEEPMFVSPIYVISIVLGVLMALFNGIVICGILLNRNLREQPKYLLILILCFLDFLAGAFNQQAFAVSSEILSRYKPSDSCSMVLWYIVEITALYESTTGILMVCIIVINWIVMVTIKAYNTGDRKKLVIAMTSFAHVGSFIIAIVSVLASVVDISEYCVLYYGADFPIVFVSEMPQLLFLVVVTIFLIISYIQQKKMIATLTFPIDLIVASIITIVCLSPFNIYSIVNFMIPLYNLTLGYMGHFVLLKLGAIRCVILPFVWLLDRHFRKELKRSLTCKGQCRNSSTESMEMGEKS